jgi:C-terminal processing protease CtpA/Prc
MLPKRKAGGFAVGILALALAAAAPPSRADVLLDPTVSPTQLLNEVERIVDDQFYDKTGLAAFDTAKDEYRRSVASPGQLPGMLAGWLAALHASHTGRYTPDEIDYYELADIFSRGMGRRLGATFPGGDVTYPGIGIAPRSIDGKVFVADVYDGSPAAAAGVEAGDEIVSVDGAPYAEIGSFAGRVGKKVTLQVRRAPSAAPLALSVPVESIRPNQAFENAIRASARIIERDGRRIGYLRIWSFASRRAEDVVMRLVSSEPLKSADGLIVDMRGRWGGAPADAADIFLGKAPFVEMIGRDGDDEIVNARWGKPVVGIVDEGSRSGMEILAHGLKRAGVPLVGTKTAGAVLAARAFMLSDNSLLLLPVADVRVDGERMEGVGVSPDIEVPYDIRYSAGADPQLDGAIAEMSRVLAD